MSNHFRSAEPIQLYHDRKSGNYYTFREITDGKFLEDPDRDIAPDPYAVFITIVNLHKVYCFDKDHGIVELDMDVSEREPWAGGYYLSVHPPFSTHLKAAGVTRNPSRKDFLEIMGYLEDRTEEGLIAEFVRRKQEEDLAKAGDDRENLEILTDKHPTMLVGVAKKMDRTKEGGFSIWLIFVSSTTAAERMEYVRSHKKAFLTDVMEYMKHNKRIMSSVVDLSYYRPSCLCLDSVVPEGELRFELKDPSKVPPRP